MAQEPVTLTMVFISLRTLPALPSLIGCIIDLPDGRVQQFFQGLLVAKNRVAP